MAGIEVATGELVKKTPTELKPYSVLLMYPDTGADMETYYEWTEAATPEEALANVRHLAANRDEFVDDRPEDFACLAVIEGHHLLLLGGEDGA